MEKVRSTLSNFELEKNLWLEVVRTTCNLINHSPSTVLDGGIIKEVWNGGKVNYSHLKVFGCETFMNIPTDRRTKLNDKQRKCVFPGIWRVWLLFMDPVNHKLLDVGM